MGSSLFLRYQTDLNSCYADQLSILKFLLAFSGGGVDSSSGFFRGSQSFLIIFRVGHEEIEKKNVCNMV